MVGFFATLQSYFYTIIVAVIILLVGFALGILAKKLVFRVLKEVGLNKIMSSVGVTIDVEKGVSIVVSFVIYLITIVFFLNQLGITSVVLYLVLGGIITLIILTFLVGLKDVIPNFVAWIVIQRRGKVKHGRRVEIREIAGVVERVGFLETEIKTYNDDILYVPNVLFIKNKFKMKGKNKEY
jgi:small-conductance mechanosensitive channel